MSTNLDKKVVRDFALSLGADVVGFAAIEDYKSPRSPDPHKILTGVRSLVVMGIRELHGATESGVNRAGWTCRMTSAPIAREVAYRVANFLEKKTGTKAVMIPVSFPQEMSLETKGMIGDVSLRHAAVAAGLGVFGRHNLVINPEFGSRMIYTAVLSELLYVSDPAVTENLCNNCNLCVDACPAHALDEESKTDTTKCLRTAQPFGVGAFIRFFSELLQKPKEEQLKMIRAPYFWDLHQSLQVTYAYNCFKCVASCPVGK